MKAKIICPECGHHVATVEIDDAEPNRGPIERDIHGKFDAEVAKVLLDHYESVDYMRPLRYVEIAKRVGATSKTVGMALARLRIAHRRMNNGYAAFLTLDDQANLERMVDEWRDQSSR